MRTCSKHLQNMFECNLSNLIYRFRLWRRPLFFRFVYDLLVIVTLFSLTFVGLNWFSIDLHGFSEIWVDFPFFVLQRCWFDLHRFAQVYVCLHRFLLSFIDFYRFSQIFMDFYRCSQIFIDFKWISQNPGPGCLAACGALWRASPTPYNINCLKNRSLEALI